MAATTKPSGLSIARNNLKFTLSWKIADSDYGAGQQLEWRIWTGKWSKWNAISIGARTTSASVSFNAADYWPNKNVFFYGINFRLRGRRASTNKASYDWSAYATCTMDLTAPETPSLSAAFSDTYDNITTFSWSTPNVSATNLKPFYDAEWQTILVKESNVTDGSKLPWKSSTLGWATGTGGATGSITRTEDSTLLAQNSYTRWVRVRARGCGGNGGIKGCSYWRYAKHVYALPYTPTINKAYKDGNPMWIRTNWTANTSASHPIDYVDVDYCIGTPRANQVEPASPSWNTVHTYKDTGGTDESYFLVNDTLDDDECLWVRVNAYHDRRQRSTPAKIAVRGALSDPTGLSVVTDASTHTATVTATNNSDVPDSKLAIVFRMSGSADVVVGVIDHGASSATVVCPDWSGASAVAFGVYAFQGSAVGKGSLTTGMYTYAITANMKSATIWDGGSVPVEPQDVTAEATDLQGEVMLTWSWTWKSANRAELSWSQNPNAWESTDEPSTYMVESLHAPKWRVSGLEMGVTWYFRVRLAYETDDGITYGPYCDSIPVDLSTTPSVPLLTLSAAVIQEGAEFTASWQYISTDGTQQANAEICEATYINDAVTYGDVIAHTLTARSIELATDWTTGTTHYLCVRVASESGKVSSWSDPVAISIADPIVISITEHSLETVTLDDGDGGTRSVLSLTEMPMTVTVEGAGDGGTTTVAIERAATYEMDRPDEDQFIGYEGETIFAVSQSGEDQITIEQEDLIGMLDDGAQYRLVATITDNYGQTDEAEIDFEVHWTHQALKPYGTVDLNKANAAVLSPIAPAGLLSGDVCDIYRLSADKPVLVVSGATFGNVYVDPYPAIGETGGYRFVYRTVNGDYITEDNEIAWYDVNAGVDTLATIIDFDGRQAVLRYDMDISHSWDKDFTETTYLGGSVQGDWNLATHRKTSVSADVVTIDDPELIAIMRRLAVYPGICHVRTVDGSSFAANVNVSESRSYDTAGKIAAFSVEISRVDSETLDGIPIEEYIA